jgi:hypothetical protein
MVAIQTITSGGSRSGKSNNLVWARCEASCDLLDAAANIDVIDELEEEGRHKMNDEKAGDVIPDQQAPQGISGQS